MAPTPPKPGTQEAQVLEFLQDGRPHQVWDRGWPCGAYTGRNAVSRLVAKGWPIRSWKRPDDTYQTYQLSAIQTTLDVGLCKGAAYGL